MGSYTESVSTSFGRRCKGEKGCAGGNKTIPTSIMTIIIRVISTYGNRDSIDDTVRRNSKRKKIKLTTSI